MGWLCLDFALVFLDSGCFGLISWFRGVDLGWFWGCVGLEVWCVWVFLGLAGCVVLV